MSNTMAENPQMPLKETACALHIKDDTLMAWIQRGDCPFGTYVRKPGRTHGYYIIIRARFEKYMRGDDMVQCPFVARKNSDIEEQLEQQYENEKKYYAEYERAKEKKSVSDKYKLRKYCEDSQLYYTEQDIVKILAPCPDILEYCRKGIFKAVNPDGHKWFIEIEAFNNLNPEIFPEKCRNRYIQYLKKYHKVHIK